MLSGLLAACQPQQTDTIDNALLKEVVTTLSSDQMQGRLAGGSEIKEAAGYLSGLFKQYGLQPMPGQENYLQTFYSTKVTTKMPELVLDGNQVPAQQVVVYADEPINWEPTDQVAVKQIGADDDFRERFFELVGNTTLKQAVVLVSTTHAPIFNRVKQQLSGTRDKRGEANEPDLAFVLTDLETVTSIQLTVTISLAKTPMSNVVAMLPGTTKPDEYVLVSAHYDHIGLLEPVGGDSVANGANDNASGVASVLGLAKHFSKQKLARSLMFIAFTAEESGLVGSEYFGKHLDFGQVVAMVNIEMIGKPSKWGDGHCYMTGYNKSTLAKLMKPAMVTKGAKLYPDPYAGYGLFYRSDNASLAKQQIPAHTISSSQIDSDTTYHQVSDEVELIDFSHLTTLTKAIAAGLLPIANNEATPVWNKD